MDTGHTPGTQWLFPSLRRRLLGRTYTDQFDGLGDMDFADYPLFATCGYCGWEGPSRETRDDAERDRWRHPNVLCWLRALWIDRVAYRWEHLPWRRPVPPCSPHGHTWAYGPWLKPGDRCYCRRSKWKVSRV